MMRKYGRQITPLLRDNPIRGWTALLACTNLALWLLSIWCGSLSLTSVILLGVFPGSILSLWQLQLLHENLHTLHSNAKNLKQRIGFWGSLPCVFGYYLYLQFGHLTHHQRLGQVKDASSLFISNSTNFEDGDILFVAHRMKLLSSESTQSPQQEQRQQPETITLKLQLPFRRRPLEVQIPSISRTSFAHWKDGATLSNMATFWMSFLLERILLVWNDVIVSVIGFNLFFPNKPQKTFHDVCTRYARVATLMRILLWKFAGWKSLLFLFLAETMWSLPPHPTAAMFVTNHPSSSNAENNGDSACYPSASTYVGRWYSVLTLATNYHTEHHDFPTMSLFHLGKLQKIAPEFYPRSDPNVWNILRKAFSKPDFYACMRAGIVEEG